MNKQTTGKMKQSVRLTEFHLRCLERRISECNDALREALSAMCEAEIEAPGDEALHVAHAALEAAQKLTAVAFKVSGQFRALPTRPRLQSPAAAKIAPSSVKSVSK